MLFLFSKTAFDAHPASWSFGTGVLSREIKGPKRDVDHSPPFSAEVKNEWSCTSINPIRFRGVDRDNVALLYQFVAFGGVCEDSGVLGTYGMSTF